jgi:transcriptional regulator with XRE-family HTH domain
VETDPILVFGKALRALRERAGLSQKELAAVVFCSASLISAIENGTKPAKLDLIERADSALNAGGALVLVWPITTEGTYPYWLARIAELEREALKIHEWEMRVIPGLLQTASYARAIMRAARRGDDDESIERDVTTRMERQQVFALENPPLAWFTLDESILHRPFGGPHTMREQLEKLEKLPQSANIIIQVMPLGTITHPGMEGPLRILEFLESPSIWYTESWESGRMVETRTGVAAAMTCYDLIRASALSPEDSIKLISSIRSAKYEQS